MKKREEHGLSIAIKNECFCGARVKETRGDEGPPEDAPALSRAHDGQGTGQPW